MPDRAAGKALRVLEPFVPIRGAIGPFPDPAVPQYVSELVKNEEAFQQFEADPDRALRARNIDPEHLDTEMFRALVLHLRERAAERGMVASTISAAESSSHEDTNFDHSSSWFFNRDGYNIIRSQGHHAEQDRSALAGTESSFAGPEVLPAELPQHEIARLQFPTQPLVTPELIEKLKERSEGGST